jgi:hypothetical protein
MLGCFGLFRFVTILFVSVVSIYVRKTETNRNNFFWFYETNRNKPKQTRNRSCFGLFRFEPKFIFVCFEDTLVRGMGYQGPTPQAGRVADSDGGGRVRVGGGGGV